MNQALQPYPNRQLGKDVDNSPTKFKMQGRQPKKLKNPLSRQKSTKNVVYLQLIDGYAVLN